MPALSSETTTYDLLKDTYPPLIGFPEAAKISNNHESTWYKWLKDGTLPVPSFSIGNCRRIRLIDLCAYIDAQATANTASKAKTKTAKRGPGRPCKVDVAALAASSHA